jgi:hypothetical protein
MSPARTAAILLVAEISGITATTLPPERAELFEK